MTSLTSEFFKTPFKPISIWMRMFLFFLPACEVLEGDSIHVFKKFNGKIYYIKEYYD